MTDVGATATQTLAEWADGLARGGVSGATQEQVRVRFVDYCSNILGGAARPSVAVLARHARRQAGSVPVPGGGTAPAELAALPLGAAAHALESDDTHQPSSSHPGAVIFSTALPLSLDTGADWRQLAAAVVAGYEIMCRIGVAADPAREYADGFHPTGTSGVFGAAATAAMLLGGGEAEITGALGIAGSMSSGSMSFLSNGSWTKHLHPGWAAHGGITAARLALDGYRAPEAVLEPPLGHLSRRGDSTPRELLDGLGTAPLAVERTSVKAHGCCRYEQSAVDAVLLLRQAHDITPDAVGEVHVSVLDAAWNIVAAPAGQKRRPATAVEAQFSMPFGVAVALARGSASVHDHTDETTRDPVILDLMDKVTCIRDPELDALYPERWPAHVAIRLRDGTQVTERVDHPKGDPENPFTLEEMLRRLHDIARHVPEPQRAALADALAGDDQPSLRTVRTILAEVWTGTAAPSPTPAAAR